MRHIESVPDEPSNVSGPHLGVAPARGHPVGQSSSQFIVHGVCNDNRSDMLVILRYLAMNIS